MNNENVWQNINDETNENPTNEQHEKSSSKNEEINQKEGSEEMKETKDQANENLNNENVNNSEEKNQKSSNGQDIIEIKIQLEETEDRLKRVAAEFDDYKKRSNKEKQDLYSSIMGDVVSAFLPVIDNLEKAVESKTEDESYKQGVELVLKQFKDVLASNGVKEIETVGKTFDPELHEAVSLVVDENLGEKEIKEEYRKGYMIGNKVIRHSMVVVAN